MKAAISEWATEALVKKKEQQNHLDALGSQSIGVARAVALKQAMAFELAEIVAELIEAVAIGGQAKAGEDGLMDLFGRPDCVSAQAG